MDKSRRPVHTALLLGRSGNLCQSTNYVHMCWST